MIKDSDDDPYDIVASMSERERKAFFLRLKHEDRAKAARLEEEDRAAERAAERALREQIRCWRPDYSTFPRLRRSHKADLLRAVEFAGSKVRLRSERDVIDVADIVHLSIRLDVLGQFDDPEPYEHFISVSFWLWEDDGRGGQLDSGHVSMTTTQAAWGELKTYLRNYGIEVRD